MYTILFNLDLGYLLQRGFLILISQLTGDKNMMDQYRLTEQIQW